jgi:biotin synthase
MRTIRHDWDLAEVFALFEMELIALKIHARQIHEAFGAQDVQKCMLLSVKTGGCPEDCGYCSQSAHYKTEISSDALMKVPEVLSQAHAAKDRGATRFCMGSAWKQIPNDRRFEDVLQMVEGVSALGMEVCCTLGTANENQLTRLKEAGLTAYNHNLDTSREFYPKVVTTRSYDERLTTLRAARKAGVQVCCGGILGLGESVRDRAALLVELSSMDPHPESVPVNLLVPVEGTPLEGAMAVPFEDFIRVVAIARILMPKSRVRLSAGRNQLSQQQQLECFSVGANSIFVGEKLLTAPNVEIDEDEILLEKSTAHRRGEAEPKPSIR